VISDADALHPRFVSALEKIMEPSSSDFRDADFAESIAEEVTAVLEGHQFFVLLDDLFCPKDPAAAARKCSHSYAGSIEILKALGTDSEEIADTLAVLKAHGGCCDCEILYNVAKESRLKAAYWNARNRESTESCDPVSHSANSANPASSPRL
jgi:hypothetical protein